MAWLTVGLRLLPLIITAIQQVERLVTAATGKDKQEAAVNLVRDVLPLIEGAMDADLIDDEKVNKAVRKVIDAVVALQNAIDSIKEP